MSSTLWTIALLAAFIAPSSHGFVAPPPPASSTSRRSTQIFRPAGGAKCTPHVAPNAVAQRLPSDHASLQRNTAGRKSFVQHSVGGEMGVSTSVEGVTTWAEERFPGCSTIVSSVTRLSGLLAEVWETLADPSAVKSGAPRVLAFPDCAAVASPRGLQSLYEHLEVCQDACEQFGTTVSIVPHPKGGNSGAPAPALVVQVVAGAGGGDEFDYDPDWDGDWDIDRSLLDDDDDEGSMGLGGGWDGVQVDTKALSVVPASDEEVTELTKDWVEAVITGMGVCPFSVDASRAGLPIGHVRYPVTRETTAESIYREYWQEVELLVSEKNERTLSTTLLITPEFSLNNAEAFEVIGQTLTQPLEALHLEDDIQLVFFHPQYAFRDGRDRIGSGDAANFARRSPFPMINILRTNQVRLAQKSIPTGLVYKQNEEVLTEVGAGELQKMLEQRDWGGLEGKKVDRKRIDYYETARKLQGVDGPTTPPEPLAPSTPTAAVPSTISAPTDTVPSTVNAPTDTVPSTISSPTAAGNGEVSAVERSGARESLTAAAGSMPTSFDKGFSGNVASATEAGGGVPTSSAAAAAAPAAPSAPGVCPAAPVASSSAGIADKDLRDVASMLVKRMSSGVPLTPGGFNGFSDAVDRILASISAGND
eukprot:jgi/Undpi1/12038/HiC_scaffold_4.g01737.m1